MKEKLIIEINPHSSKYCKKNKPQCKYLDIQKYVSPLGFEYPLEEVHMCTLFHFVLVSEHTTIVYEVERCLACLKFREKNYAKSDS